MSECISPETVPVKVDKRKIMNPKKLERLAKARETRARNLLVCEEKRMELAKQMILASAGAPATTVKSNPEEKKLKWEAQKNEILNEMSQMLSAANLELRERKKQEALEPESECSDAPPGKKQKTPKPPAAEKPKSKSKKLSSHSGTSGRSAKRKPVKPAVISESEESSESESSEEGEVEHENVLRLW